MRKKRVLIVDNDTKIRSKLSKILGKDFEIVEAEDGVKGYSCAVLCEPDVIFVDCKLPYMNGFDLYERLKVNLGPEVKVVFMTSWLNGVSEEIQEFPSCPFIEKPLKAGDIRKALETIQPKQVTA